VYRELEEKWNVYFVLPNQSSYYNDPEIAGHWTDLLGERFLKLEDPAAVCELIALTVGIGEDRIDLNDGLADLRDVGSTAEATTVGKALARITKKSPARVAALPSDLGTGADDVDFD
jgi:hypothetical protein